LFGWGWCSLRSRPLLGHGGARSGASDDDDGGGFIARLREQPSKNGCERREIARRRTEKERAEAFFPLRATTTAADSSRDCASSPQKGRQPST
jgi:hypothetical protein